MRLADERSSLGLQLASTWGRFERELPRCRCTPLPLLINCCSCSCTRTPTPSSIEELARRELAPLALHAYCEAYSDFKRCMLSLLACGSGLAQPDAELRQFAGMVARALRQELAASSGAAASSPPQLLQLLRYLLLLHQHQHHGGFHPYW